MKWISVKDNGLPTFGHHVRLKGEDWTPFEIQEAYRSQYKKPKKKNGNKGWRWMVWDSNLNSFMPDTDLRADVTHWQPIYPSNSVPK